MFNVKTSQIMKQLAGSRGPFAADTAAHRVWTNRFAAKAKVPQELVAAAFFGHNLNQRIDGKSGHSDEMLGRLSQYLTTKIKNKDLPPESQVKLLRVKEHVTQAIAGRVAQATADLRANLRIARAPLIPRQVAPRASAPAPQRPGAVTTFNQGVLASSKKWQEAKGLIEQMERASGPDRDRLGRQAKTALRQVNSSLTRLIASAPLGANVDLARKLKKSASDKMADL